MSLTSQLRSKLSQVLHIEELIVSKARPRSSRSWSLSSRTMSSNYNCDSTAQETRSYEVSSISLHLFHIDQYIILFHQNAVQTLNELQSNLSAFTMATSQVHQSNNTSKADAQRYLEMSGITMEQLDTLSVIHVSGTKGKGSTCALVESILRATGVRTGFYSSPHLVDVTERFRLDGKPISRHKFAKYFWQVYEALESSKVITTKLSLLCINCLIDSRNMNWICQLILSF